jgi:myo-inositol 2-dehydrogenase/D-chiro-inositol 1-dehydrogenase
MVRVAVAGTGLAFDLHAKALNALDDACLSAVVSRDIAKAEKAAAPWGARACSRQEEAFPCCDAVALCTPPGTHRALAIAAMEAGKAVLVEKPMAVELDDAKAMVESSERTGQILAMGFNNCFRDGFIMLHDMIAGGVIGALNSFYIHRQSKGMIREGESSWRNSPGAVCGHVVESLSHDLSILRYCAGDVKTVQAATLCSLPFAPEYDNTAVVSMELSCGAVAGLFSDWNSALGFNMRGASGSKGAISLYGAGNWENREARIRLEGSPYDEIRVINDSLDQQCYIREYRAFIDDIQNRTGKSFTGIDGLKVLEISRAILESAKTGKAVTL